MIKPESYEEAMTHSKNDYNQQMGQGWGFNFFEQKSETPLSDKNSFKSDSLNAGKSFPLAMASVGERLRIVKLKGTEGTVRRLIGMGLVAGTELQIINIADGSIIVALGECRIGLGVGLAQKIMCTNA